MNKKTKADIILISALLVITALSYLFLQMNSKEGHYAIVAIDGVETERYSLDKNGQYALNGGTNILVIEDGYAYLIDANCPDKLCVSQGKIQYTGQCITCLPNKLTVTIVGNDNGGTDLVS